MSKTSQLLLFLLISSVSVSAQEQTPEIIEILAPKQQMTSSSSNQATDFYDDRFEHNLNRTVADQLATISGVSLNGQGGQFQSYAIRGFSRGRVRTEVDGIPIITDRRAGNSISFLATDLFSGISVIKGPSSTLYGSQALGGVVNLSTSMAEQTSLQLEGQTGSEYKALTFKHKQNNLALGLAYQEANNDQASNGDELNTQFKRASGFVRYQRQNNGLTTTFSWLPSLGKDIGKSNLRYLNSEISDYPEEIHSLAQLQLNSEQDWLIKFFHHYQNWDSSTLRLEQYDSLTEYQSHTLGIQWLSQFHFNEVKSDIGIDWLARKGVSIGTEYELFQPQDELTVELLANELTGEKDNLAIYNKNQWQFGSTQLSLSFRYDWLQQQSGEYSDATEQEFNAAFTANVPLSTSLSMGFELANGFRYPTLSERFFNGSTPRGLILGNQDLVPETSLGIQTSFDWQANTAVEVRGAFYHYELDNYIERYRLNDNLLSYRNLSEAEISGLELEVYWFVNDNLEQQFKFQQQNGHDNQNQRLDDLLPKKLSWSMLASFNDLSITNSLSHYFSADRVGSSEAERERYTLWDMSLNYQLSATQSISLVLNNIANQSYYGSLDEDASLQPERSIKLSTTWHF